MADGDRLHAAGGGTIARIGGAANGNRARRACHGVLPGGKAVLSFGICADAEGDGCQSFRFGAVADGDGITAAGAGTLADGDVVGGGHGGRAVICAVGIGAEGDIVFGLDAFCRAGTDTNHIINRRGAAHVTDRAFADADVAVVVGVACVITRPFADKHIGATRRVGIPAQGGRVFACGF